MFGSVYDGKDQERPRYGNLNFLANRGGEAHARQYGKSYLKMKPRLIERCTVTSRDSSDAYAKMGTPKYCAHVLLDQYKMLKKTSHQRDFVRALLKLSRGEEPGSITRNLNKRYIEVQFHGDICVQRDVAMVVLSDEDAEKAQKHRGVVQRFKDLYNVDVYRITTTGRLVAGDFYDPACRLASSAGNPKG